jgi:hypothetical protein
LKLPRRPPWPPAAGAQNTASFRTDALAWLVLDEADRLLDLGFESKISEIVSTIESRGASLEDHEGGRGSRAGAAGYGQGARQTVLLSATLPPALGAFARQLMRPGAAAVGFTAEQLNEQPAADGGGPDADGEAGPAATAEPEQFEVPSQLRQAFVEVPAKLRLVALVAALRARLRPRGGAGGGAAKIVVFFSNCDSVEYHHALLSCCSGPGGGDDDEEGEGGGVAGLLPVAPLKLHGDLPQAERTSNMLRFAKVRLRPARLPRMRVEPTCTRATVSTDGPPPALSPQLSIPARTRSNPTVNSLFPPSPAPARRPRRACCSAPTWPRAAWTSPRSRPSCSTTPRGSRRSTCTAWAAPRGWGRRARR